MEIRVRLIISCVISFDATFRQGACSPIWMRPSRITANPLSPHESAILQPSRMGLRTSRSCLTLRVHLGCVRSRLCILGETGIARIPRYTNCAALVLVCSLVVHALRVSLHQERARVGASHRRFWSLAGGIQEHSLLAISTLWQAAMYRVEQGPLFWPQRAAELRK